MRQFAILGGGLTGLSAAFHLSRRFPRAQIDLIEKLPRLGGWVHSERVDLDPKSSVLVEFGPRTLRPNSKSVLELIHLLQLKESLITTSKTSPAAKSRFIKLTEKDNGAIIPIPSPSISSLFSSPLTPLLLKTILKEPFRTASAKFRRPTHVTDESLDSFLTRHFGPTFARIFGSALVHGIYAADSRKLSIRAAFPSLWEAEQRGMGSLLLGLLRPKSRSKSEGLGIDEYDYELGNVQELMKGVSVFSFKDGIQTLTTALENAIVENPCVRIRRSNAVQGIGKTIGNDFELVLSSGTSIHATHIISTLPLPVLHRILTAPSSVCSPSSSVESSRPAQTLPPHLTHNPYNSVTVVNLIFGCSPSQIHPPGFGYLIPRSEDGYPVLGFDATTPSSSPSSPSFEGEGDANANAITGTSLGILGCVFDSAALATQDLVPSAARSPGGTNGAEKAITKVTFMLGGPYGTSPAYLDTLSSGSLADLPPLVTRLIRHLESATVPLASQSSSSPTSTPPPLTPLLRAYRIHPNAACIPTYLPHHLERMQEMRAVLKQGEVEGGWGGRLRVIGAGVAGVSVGNCVEAGRLAACGW